MDSSLSSSPRNLAVTGESGMKRLCKTVLVDCSQNGENQTLQNDGRESNSKQAEEEEDNLVGVKN